MSKYKPVPHVTQAEKVEAATAIFKLPGATVLSNRELARRAGVSEHMIRRMRIKLGLPSSRRTGYSPDTHAQRKRKGKTR